MPFPQETLRLVLGCVYDLYRHRVAAGIEQVIATTLARAITCDSAAHITLDPQQRSVDAAWWPTSAVPLFDRSVLYALHERDHPLTPHYRQSRDTRAWRLSDLVDADQFRSTELYRAVYQSLGIEHQLVMLLASPDQRVRLVALHRRHPAFTEDERLLLELLWPHLTQVVRTARLANRRGERTMSIAEGAERRGVMVVRGDGSVVLCTEPARVWLREYFGWPVAMHRIELPERLAAWLGERLAEERKGRLLPPARRDPLVIAKDDRALVINVVLGQAKDEHLLSIDEELLVAPVATLTALGLTQREAEVLAWVAQGKTNREIGMILGSSGRTVQKHLEHVFQKIGVESRTAAILRAWQVGRYAVFAPA